jgi:hypothetical protein
MKAGLRLDAGGITNQDVALRQAAGQDFYNTRLIADVVTGKLDVRAAAAAVPEAIEEPEALYRAMDSADEEAIDDVIDAKIEEAAA